MKIRLDFVTNSSSSSFTCVALYSEDLYNYLQKLIAEKKYVHQPGWSSWARPEDELHLKWAWEELKFDGSDYKVQITEEYGGTDKESVLKYIGYFFEGLSPDEKETLRKLVFEVYKTKEYQTHKYNDYTDGYVGFDFRGKLTKADLQSGSKKEKIQELLTKIGNMAIDPETADFSMKAIGVPFSKIDGRGVYDPESGRYDHIDKRFLNRVSYTWDNGFDEEYNRYQFEEAKKDKWGEYLRSAYDDAIDDIGAIALYDYSTNNDYVVVMDSVESAVEKYVVIGFINNHELGRFGYVDDDNREILEILKENYFIGYLKRIISFINDTNKGRGPDKAPIGVILESQLHDYLMKNSSLGGAIPKPVVGPNGTVRKKVPEGLKRTVDHDISELFSRWPSRIVNPKTRTYERIAKDIEDNKEKLGYQGVEEFLDAYGFAIKQEVSRENVSKYGDFEYEKTKKTNEITIAKYTGTDAKVIIPDSIDGAPVKTIGKEAFCMNKSVEEVIVPDSVVTMRGGAFSFCGNLKSVHLSDNISKIVAESFDGCGKLEEVNIPDMVEEIPSGLFKDCPLKTLHIGKSLIKLNKDDFYKGEWLSNNAFDGYAKSSEMEAITINSENRNLKSIGSMILTRDGKVLLAMLGSEASCTVPAGVEIIADKAFACQVTLKEIAFPESLILIGNEAFEYSGLKSVSIPSNVKTIGYRAFFCCKSMINVELSEGIEEIYNYAFYGNEILSIVFPNSLKRYGGSSFSWWQLRHVEPDEWAQTVRGWYGVKGFYEEQRVNTKQIIEELEKERIRAEIDSQMENRIGFGLLVYMMAYLQSEEAEKMSLEDRLKIEHIVISKEMEKILGTDLKLILSVLKGKATVQLNNCINYLKADAEAQSVNEYLVKIKEAFGSDKEMALFIDRVASLIGKEA